MTESDQSTSQPEPNQTIIGLTRLKSDHDQKYSSVSNLWNILYVNNHHLAQLQQTLVYLPLMSLKYHKLNKIEPRKQQIYMRQESSACLKVKHNYWSIDQIVNSGTSSGTSGIQLLTLLLESKLFSNIYSKWCHNEKIYSMWFTHTDR